MIRETTTRIERCRGWACCLGLMMLLLCNYPLTSLAEDTQRLQRHTSVTDPLQSEGSEVLPTPRDGGPLPVPPTPRQHLLPLQVSPNDVVVSGDEGLISLAVRDAPLRQVLALIAETQKLNIVFAAPTDTLVTASFERVPWQKAFEALMSISGHTWTMSDNILFVSSISEADSITPNAGGRMTHVFELDFVSAVDAEQAVLGLLSPAGKSWVTESSTSDNRRTRESIAVVDYPGHLVRVGDYIDQIDQPPRQVYIEAHILQVDLKDDCRNGVNFANLVRLANPKFSLGTAGFTSGADASGLIIESDMEGGIGLSGLIEILQTTTDAKTLASPKIHGVSGQESQLQIGQKLPYRNTTTTQTSTMESVEFLEVGVVLSVTPRVTRDGRVIMRVLPKVSTGTLVEDGIAGKLPQEDTTELATDVMLNSGQGMVLGGLIQEVVSNTQSKVPWLGDIPYAGVLFQRRVVTKERKEIIIALVPHVLPYQPIMAQKQAHALMRARDPLTHGPLYVVPRPYEAAMPDTCTNPTPVVRNAMRAGYSHLMHHNTVPQALPLVDDEASWPMIEYDSVPEIQFPSQLYPPIIEYDEH